MAPNRAVSAVCGFLHQLIFSHIPCQVYVLSIMCVGAVEESTLWDFFSFFSDCISYEFHEIN